MGTDTVRIEPLTGDICTLDLPPASFDAIMSNQTIEHVHDLDAMFDVCFAALRPGGRIVIANTNNALNSKNLATMKGRNNRATRTMIRTRKIR